MENVVLVSAEALLAQAFFFLWETMVMVDPASISLHLDTAGYCMNHSKICCILPLEVCALLIPNFFGSPRLLLSSPVPCFCLLSWIQFRKIIFVKKMSIDHIILNMVLSSNLINLNLYGEKRGWWRKFRCNSSLFVLCLTTLFIYLSIFLSFNFSFLPSLSLASLCRYIGLSRFFLTGLLHRVHTSTLQTLWCKWK